MTHKYLKFLLFTLIAHLSSCGDNSYESEAKYNPKVDYGVQHNSNYVNYNGNQIKAAQAYIHYRNMSLQDVRNNFATGNSKLVPKYVYGIKFTLDLDPLYQGSQESVTSGLKRTKKKKKYTEIEKMRAKVHVVTLNEKGYTQKQYDSNPDIKKKVDQTVNEELDKLAPTISMIVDNAFSERERRSIKYRNDAEALYRGIILTYGHKLKKDFNMFVYIEAGEGTLTTAPTDEYYNSKYNDITLMDNDVENLTGFKSTGFVNSGLIMELKNNLSLEVSFAAVHTKDRVHFNNSTEKHLLDSLQMEKTIWHDSNKLFVLDSYFLRAVLRTGLNSALTFSTSVGHEKKVALGAIYNKAKMTTVINLLYVVESTEELEKGFHSEALISKKEFLLPKLTGYASIGYNNTEGWDNDLSNYSDHEEKYVKMGLSYEVNSNLSISVGTELSDDNRRPTKDREQTTGYLIIRYKF